MPPRPLSSTFRSDKNCRGYSNLNPITRSKLTRSNYSKHLRKETPKRTGIRKPNNRRPSTISTTRLPPLRQDNKFYRRYLEQETEKKIKTLQLSKGFSLPEINRREKDGRCYNASSNYLNPYTSNKIQRANELKRRSNEPHAFLNQSGNKSKYGNVSSRYLSHLDKSTSNSTNQVMPANKVMLASETSKIPPIHNTIHIPTGSDSNVNLPPIHFNIPTTDLNKSEPPPHSNKTKLLNVGGYPIDVFLTPTHCKDCIETNDIDAVERRRRRPMNNINNFNQLRKETANDFRGCGESERKAIQFEDSCLRPLAKWCALPDITQKVKTPLRPRDVPKVEDIPRKHGPTQKDEIPIPTDGKPLHKQLYPYRYSSAKPSWSGKTKKENEILQCRNQFTNDENTRLLERVNIKPGKDLKLKDCYQNRNYETTALVEGLRPFRYQARENTGQCGLPSNCLKATKKLHAPWKSTSEFGRYVTDVLHPDWTGDQRYKRKVLFHSNPPGETFANRKYWGVHHFE